MIGAAALVIATAVMAGWALRSEPLLRLLTVPPMVFNSALCFALAAMALIGDAASPPRRVLLHTVLGTAIAAVAAAAVVDQVFALDLGISGKSLHEWFPDIRHEAGRMSLAAGIGFMLVGLHFIAGGYVPKRAVKYLMNAVSAAIVSIGLFKLMSNALGLEALFANRFFQLESPSTAVGFVAIGAGQWLAWRRREASRLADDDRIVLTGSAWALVVGAAIGFAAVLTLARSTDDALRDGLRQTVINRADLLAEVLEGRVTAAETLANQPDAIIVLRALQSAPRDAERILDLRAIATRQLDNGFSLVEFRGADGEPLAAAAARPADATLLFVLKHRYAAKFLWQQGAVLHVEVPIPGGERPLGMLYAQMPLPGIDRRVFDLEGTRLHSAQFICAATGRILPCVPDRQQATAFAVIRETDDSVHPARLALAGGTGLAEGFDYRGRQTISAFAPVRGFGLGLILSVHADELLQPLGERLTYLLPLMLALLAGGALLLRSAVKPLAERLHDSEQRLKLALEGSRFALWDWNVATGTVYLSEQWPEMIGGPPGAAVATIEALEALAHPDDLPGLKQHVRDALKGAVDHYDFEHRVRSSVGEWIWIRSRGRVVSRDRDQRALRLTGTISNISARKRAELALEHQATHDALSGLPNRSLFYDRLDQALRRSERTGARLAVLYLDMDQFKQCNDRYGHAVGDAVLREFGRRVSRAVRAADTVSRLAGDEFAVIAQDLAHGDDAVRIAEKIFEAMRAPFEVAGHRVDVATSIGIAVHEGDGGTDADHLVARADSALYDAKNAGRGTYRVAT